MSLKVFDCHIHVGFCDGVIAKKEDGFFVPVEEVINYLDQNGIQKALIFPFPNPKTSSLETNKYIVQCIEKEKGRLYGLLYFSWNENPRELLEFAGPNIVGIKIHPTFSQRIITEIPDTLLEIIRDNKWILLTDSSISTLGQPVHIVKFAKDNPDIPIICAHMARLFHKEILEIAELDNVYLDISGICLLSESNYRLAPQAFRHISLKENFSPQDILEYLLHFAGKKKLIWGSDFPFPQIFGGRLDSEIIFILKEAFSFLDKKAHQDILNNNVESLLQQRVS